MILRLGSALAKPAKAHCALMKILCAAMYAMLSSAVNACYQLTLEAAILSNCNSLSRH